jgi:hypothetical protein
MNAQETVIDILVKWNKCVNKRIEIFASYYNNFQQ